MNRIGIIGCLAGILCGQALAQDSAPPSGAIPTTPKTAGTAATAPQPGPAPKKKASAVKKRSAKTAAQAEPTPQAAAPATPPPTPPPPAAPQLPPTLMNQPPVSPTVTMNNGLLTIDAPNCTLSEVLNKIRQATGAVLEGISPSDRVAVRLGPGSPREVIAALLQGTPYDYLILGSEEDAEAVTRILLTRGASPSEPAPPSQPQSASQPFQEPPQDFFPPDQGGVPQGGAQIEEGEQPQPPPPQPVNPEQPGSALPQNQFVPQPPQP